MYVLDTHALLWLLFRPEKLSANAVEIISDPTTDLRLSVISLWEISLKYSLGRLKLEGLTPDLIPDAATRSGIKFLNLTPKTTAGFHNLPREKHKDPFDRMIIWQAISHQATLISKDTQLSSYQQSGLKLLW